MTNRHISIVFLLSFIGLTIFQNCYSNTGEVDAGLPPPNVILIFTDDQGYADLSVQGILDDIRTPNIDSLAMNGVRFTDGYVTAPVCGPSRVGIITGKYQQRFGVDANKTLNIPLDVMTFPQYLKKANYVSGLSGKTHFGRNMPTMGFDEYFAATSDPWSNIYNCTHDLDGYLLANVQQYDLDEHNMYRVDAETDAAVQFIDRNHNKPFFLYLAYTAPHVELEATEKYLNRFPDVTDEKRRLCLAMISAMDDGVGRIMATLRKYDIEENTILFFISDNGAPLDSVYMEYARDGSLNTPLSGEKGTYLEGGIRVPWIVYWKEQIPGGQVLDIPVSTLDVLPTVLTAARIKTKQKLDGLNLLPTITSKGMTPLPERKLFWYGRAQQAILSGNWKLFRTTHNGYVRLVDIENDIEEKFNLADQHPDIVENLLEELNIWQSQMNTPPAEEMHPVIESIIFRHIDL